MTFTWDLIIALPQSFQVVVLGSVAYRLMLNWEKKLAKVKYDSIQATLRQHALAKSVRKKRDRYQVWLKEKWSILLQANASTATLAEHNQPVIEILVVQPSLRQELVGVGEDVFVVVDSAERHGDGGTGGEVASGPGDATIGDDTGDSSGDRRGEAERFLDHSFLFSPGRSVIIARHLESE